MNLVAYVGKDNETWGQLTALIKRMDAERIFLVTNQEVKDFPASEKCMVIDVDGGAPLLDLKSNMIERLKPQLVSDFEVALSLASGTGKEHMALISALLSIPVGIRLVVFTKNGVEVIN